MLHPVGDAHRTGNVGGGVLLEKSVLLKPALISWKATLPMLMGAAAGLPWSTVVQASVNPAPLLSLTVTSSFVGVGL